MGVEDSRASARTRKVLTRKTNVRVTFFEWEILQVG